MNIDLTDQDITQVRFDYAVSFLTEDQSILRIQTSFTLTDLDGTIEIDPEDSRSDSSRILALLHSKIDRFAYDPAGNLLLVAGTIRFHVSPDPNYEAWNLSRRDNTLLVCKIGGGVAVWPSTDTDGAE